MARPMVFKLMVLILLLALAACNSDGSGSSSNSVNGGSETSDVAKSDLKRDTSPDVSEEDVATLVAGNTEFAMDMFQYLADSDENVFFSPYSMSMCFAMLYGGARTTTELQMKDVFHFDLDQDTLHKTFNRLDLSLRPIEEEEAAREDEEIGFTLEITNSFWAEQTYPFKDSYLDFLAVNYGSEIHLVDFLNNFEQVRLDVNEWTSEQTEGLIPELFPPKSFDELTVFAAVNAIYFKAAWLEQFDEEYTYDETFNTPGGEVTCSMMLKSDNYQYTETEDYQAIEVPYKDEKTSMVLLLPAEGYYDLFEQSLTPEVLNTILDNLESSYITLYMPKFKSKPDALKLNDILSYLGMPEAFVWPDADFSGIDGRDDYIFLQTAMHQAVISVDEKCTEAAAATGASGGAGGYVSPPLCKFDRPFIYLIRDLDTGSILFMGRMLDPTETPME